jgi:hypothetical protein
VHAAIAGILPGLVLALGITVLTATAWKAFKDARNLEQLPDYLQQRINLSACLFEDGRPGPCLKGPLPAPNPGMVWGQP